ncbi:MAG TPA: hypothetical protein VG735_07845 [Caulobacterales bacterium]|nr:hypothetical protein [Caulobacterales bacterium]
MNAVALSFFVSGVFAGVALTMLCVPAPPKPPATVGDIAVFARSAPQGAVSCTEESGVLLCVDAAAFMHAEPKSLLKDGEL